MRQGAWAVWAMLAPVAAAQSVIVEAKVPGAQRFDPQAILSASGIRAGQTATQADLDEAARRLSATGMFASVDYRWEAGVLTWRITEAAPKLTVLLDIPGIDAREFWEETGGTSLMRSRIPGNDAATAYCERAIEAFLLKRSRKEQVVSANTADLTGKPRIGLFHPADRPTITVIRFLAGGSGEVPIMFRLAHPPKVGGVRFEGNHAIDEAALGRAAGHVIVGREYSEYDIRNILELNIRPLYDWKGRLSMKFLKVSMEQPDGGSGTVVASVSIDEGPEWRLGKAEPAADAPLAGDRSSATELRRFEPTDWGRWRQAIEAVQKSELALKRRGYLDARAMPVGSIRTGGEIVDLGFEVNKGPLSLFGQLELIGLDSADRQQANRLWKLSAGAPLDGVYLADYMNKALQALKGRTRSVGRELRRHLDSNVVDVVLTFR